MAPLLFLFFKKTALLRHSVGLAELREEEERRGNDPPFSVAGFPKWPTHTTRAIEWSTYPSSDFKIQRSSGQRCSSALSYSSSSCLESITIPRLSTSQALLPPNGRVFLTLREAQTDEPPFHEGADEIYHHRRRARTDEAISRNNV